MLDPPLFMCWHSKYILLLERCLYACVCDVQGTRVHSATTLERTRTWRSWRSMWWTDVAYFTAAYCQWHYLHWASYSRFLSDGWRGTAGWLSPLYIKLCTFVLLQRFCYRSGAWANYGPRAASSPSTSLKQPSTAFWNCTANDASCTYEPAQRQ